MKPRIYSLYEAMAVVGEAARNGKPRKFIWVETKKGPCKMLNPVMEWDGLSGQMVVAVAPRYQVTFTNMGESK
jgi:hypothetical protein